MAEPVPESATPPPNRDEEARPNGDALRPAADFALDQTLAVPVRPKILELQLSQTDTVNALDRERLSERPSDDDAFQLELRHPKTTTQFDEVYDTASDRVRELGRGGIGRVLLVFDRTLGRDVALKELLPELQESGPHSSQESQSHSIRFLREARITGQLEHPNIVPVYELGQEPNGSLYYTMRVVRGRTLTSAIQGTCDIKERLSLVNHFAGLCQAIAYAHSRGVLHRDIKPDNVMIGEFGETFVLDWGLAKIIEERSPQSLRAAATLSRPPTARSHRGALSTGKAESFNTQSGSIVGTPLFMSPEQIMQSGDATKPTGDVWALGVVLYYILTGKLPFSGTTLTQLIASILAASPERIAETCPEAPRDLAAIAERALAKDPAKRYTSAIALAKDIAAYQAGEKVTAYEYGSIELLERFVRRNQAATLISLIALFTVVLLTFSSYRGVTQARDLAVLAERRAVRGETLAKSSLSEVLVERALASIGDGDYATSTLLAVGALELNERPDARGIVVAQTNAERLEPVTIAKFPTNCDHIAWNPTLRELACGSSGGVYLSSLGQPHVAPRLANLPSGPLISLHEGGWLVRTENGGTSQLRADNTPIPWPILPSNTRITAASDDGRVLVREDASGTLEVWTTYPPKRAATLHLGTQLTALSLHAAAESVAIGTHRGDILLWNWRHDSEPHRLGSARSTVHALAFAPRGTRLLSGGEDRSVMLWDTAAEQLWLMPFRAESPVTALSWSQDGKWFAVGGKSTGIDVLDSDRLERVMRVPLDQDQVSHLDFTAENELLVTTADRSARLLKLTRSTPPARFTSSANILSMAWSPAHDRLLLGGLGDKGLCHLTLTTGICTDRLPVRLGLVRRIVVSPDSSKVILGGTGGRLEVWDASQKLPLGFIPISIPEVREIVFTDNPKQAVIAGTSKELLTVDVESLSVVASRPVPYAVQAMVQLAKSRNLLLGFRSGDLALYSTVESRIVRKTNLSSQWVMGAVANQGEDLAWATTADGQLVTLTLPNLESRKRMNLHAGRPTAIALSEKLGLLASCGEDRTVQVATLSATPQVLATLNEHQGTVRALVFDEIGNRLISAGDDGTVRLWDLRRLRLEASSLRHEIETTYGLRRNAGRIVSTKP